MFEHRGLLTYAPEAGADGRLDASLGGPLDVVETVGILPRLRSLGCVASTPGSWLASPDQLAARERQCVGIHQSLETRRRPDADPPPFDSTLVEGTPSLDTLAMLIRTDPKTLPREDRIAGAVGIEKATRMLAALGAIYHAAAGPAPSGDEVDDVAHEISVATGLHPVATTNRVDVEREIVRTLPLSLERLRNGELTWRQVERVQRLLSGLDDDAIAAVERAAVPGAPEGLSRRIATALARLAPDHVEKNTKKVDCDRTVLHWSDPVGGVAGVELQGPLAKVAQIKAAIDSRARHRHPDDDRPIAARRFDVLYLWARSALGLDHATAPDSANAAEPTRSAATVATTSGPVPEGTTCSRCGRDGPARIPINVTVSLATLLRLSEDPGELDGHPIPAEVARALAADGRWRRMAFDDSGRLSDIGQHTYVPRADVARYVRARDRTCRFPTCSRPAERCDVDHVRAFHTEGGLTCPENLASLCRHHHRLKHETGWTYRLRDNGDATWTAPSGRSYTSPSDDRYDDPALSRRIAAANAWLKQRRDRAARVATARSRPWQDPWIAPPAGSDDPDDLPF